jgi:tetratricopeptide (TPR) repeat protein
MSHGPSRLLARTLGAATAVAALLAAPACSQRDPLEDVRAQQAAGNYAATLEPLRALIEAKPDDPELHYLHGMALMRTSQPSLAAWSLRKAMEDPAWLSRAGLQLAASAMLTGNAEVAIETTGKLLEAEPENVAALVLRAEAKAASRRDYEGALADADRALELDPDEQNAMVTRAVALLGLARVDDAEKAIAELERRVLEADLGSEAGARFCLVRATFLKEKGDAKSAETGIEGCLEKYPKDGRVVGEAIEFHDAAGNAERSLAILRASLAAAPEATGYRVALAMRLEQAGAREEAEQLLREGTESKEPALASISWVDLANLYASREDFGASAGALAKAISLSPDPRPELLFQHAETLLLAGRNAEARAEAERLGVPAHRELVLARALLAEGKPQEALARFDAGLALWPDNGIARYYAARAAEQLGDFDRAIAEYRYAIRAGIDQTDARYRLARLHEAERAYDLAIVAARHTSATVPADPEAERVALRILARLGRLHEARDVIALRSRQPERWGPTVAAMAEGLAQSQGAAAAAKLVRETEALDLREPRNADALRALVRFLCEAGDAVGARAAADAAIAAHPDVAAFHALRGDALAQAGAPAADVRAAYERALALDAGHVPALAGLARLAAASNDVEGALALYARLGEVDTTELGDGAPRRAWAELLLAQGRKDEAAARLADLLLLDPYDGSAAARLAELRGGDASLSKRAERFAAAPPPKAAPAS